MLTAEPYLLAVVRRELSSNCKDYLSAIKSYSKAISRPTSYFSFGFPLAWEASRIGIIFFGLIYYKGSRDRLCLFKSPFRPVNRSINSVGRSLFAFRNRCSQFNFPMYF
jgi:hypothetical protein